MFCQENALSADRERVTLAVALQPRQCLLQCASAPLG